MSDSDIVGSPPLPVKPRKRDRFRNWWRTKVLSRSVEKQISSFGIQRDGEEEQVMETGKGCNRASDERKYDLPPSILDMPELSVFGTPLAEGENDSSGEEEEEEYDRFEANEKCEMKSGDFAPPTRMRSFTADSATSISSFGSSLDSKSFIDGIGMCGEGGEGEIEIPSGYGGICRIVVHEARGLENKRLRKRRLYALISYEYMKHRTHTQRTSNPVWVDGSSCVIFPIHAPSGDVRVRFYLRRRLHEDAVIGEVMIPLVLLSQDRDHLIGTFQSEISSWFRVMPPSANEIFRNAQIHIPGSGIEKPPKGLGCARISVFLHCSSQSYKEYLLSRSLSYTAMTDVVNGWHKPTFKDNVRRVKALKEPPFINLYIQYIRSWDSPKLSLSIYLIWFLICFHAQQHMYPILFSLSLFFCGLASYLHNPLLNPHSFQFRWDCDVHHPADRPKFVLNRLKRYHGTLVKTQKGLGTTASIVEKASNIWNFSDPLLTQVSLALLFLSSLFLSFLIYRRLLHKVIFLVGFVYFLPPQVREVLRRKKEERDNGAEVGLHLDHHHFNENNSETNNTHAPLSPSPSPSAVPSSSIKGKDKKRPLSPSPPLRPHSPPLYSPHDDDVLQGRERGRQSFKEKLKNYWSHIPDNKQLEHRLICRQLAVSDPDQVLLEREREKEKEKLEKEREKEREKQEKEREKQEREREKEREKMEKEQIKREKKEAKMELKARKKEKEKTK